MVKFTEPWGWSKLDTYRECKAKFKYQYIDKLPQPGNAAMARGNTMHEDIEAYLRGWSIELPGILYDWKQSLDTLLAKDFVAEQALGLDKNWSPLKDWFQKETWLRSKMDAKVLDGDELNVIDFKSGKYRVPSEDQVELYSIVGHAQHPTINKVRASFWFLDQNDAYDRTYTGEQLITLRKKFEKEAKAIYDTEVWSESPSRACKYCPYSKSNGGPCKY